MRRVYHLGHLGHRGRLALVCAALLCALSSAACSGWAPYAPPLQREMPEGPGLFSGPDGEFVFERALSRPGKREGVGGEGAEEEEEERALPSEEDRP